MQSKCPRNGLATHFLYFSNMKWAIQAREEEKNKPQTFSADGWTGESKIFSQIWWRNEQKLPSPEPRTSELNGSGGGRGKGIRGRRPFVPVGDTNRDKRVTKPGRSSSYHVHECLFSSRLSIDSSALNNILQDKDIFIRVVLVFTGFSP